MVILDVVFETVTIFKIPLISITDQFPHSFCPKFHPSGPSSSHIYDDYFVYVRLLLVTGVIVDGTTLLLVAALLLVLSPEH